MKKGTKLASLLIGLALIIPACNKPTSSSTPAESSNPASSETSAEQSSSQQENSSSQQGTSSQSASSSSQAASSSSQASSSSEAPVNYTVSITNKEALQAEWFVGDQGRKVEISTEPRANIAVLISEGKIQITSSDPTVAAVSGQMVNPVAAGSATIKVKCGNSEDTVVVTLAAKQTAKEKYGTQHEGTLEDPFDNEDAVSVANNKNYNNEDFYIRGKVLSFYHAAGVLKGDKYVYARNDGACSYYLEPAAGKKDKFEVYMCYKEGKDEASYLTDNDIWIGGIALAHGKLTTYKGQAETSAATFVSCEGTKPAARQIVNKTFAEVMTAGAALPDGGDSWDFYKFRAFVTSKEGNNYWVTATKGEELVKGKSDKDHGERDIYTNALELYFSAAPSQTMAGKLLEGAEVELTMIVKNYHGTVENLLQLADEDVTVVNPGEAWKVPEPTVEAKTIAEFKQVENNKSKAYKVTGIVKSWKNETADKDKYGNMVLTDGEGNDLTIYGATVTETALAWDMASSYAFTNPQDFLTNEQTAALAIGDTVEMKLIRADYQGAIQGSGVITKITSGSVPQPQFVSLAKYEFETQTEGNVNSIASDLTKVDAIFKKVAGSDLYDGATAAENVYEGGSGGKDATAFTIFNILKIGKSKKAGSLTFKLKAPVSKVVVTGDAWTQTASLTINDVTVQEAFKANIISKDAITDGKLNNAGTLSFEFEASDTIEIKVGNSNSNANFGVAFDSMEFFGEQGGQQAAEQPVGSYHGQVKLIAAMGGAYQPVDMELAADSVEITINGETVAVASYEWDGANRSISIVTDGIYGTLTASYDQTLNAFTVTGVSGQAGQALDPEVTAILYGHGTFYNCTGTTEELQNLFQRRFWRPGQENSWQKDNSNADRVSADETNRIGNSGNGVKLRPCGGQNTSTGEKYRVSISLKNDFAEAKAVTALSFWVFNPSENDITLRAWGYQAAGYNSNYEFQANTTLTAKAGSWTYMNLSFWKNNAPQKMNMLNFQVADFTGSGVAFTFDNFCLL